MCVIYIAGILKLAYFSREPDFRASVDMRLLGTWGATAVEHAYVIENILMFLPFEILFPFAFHIFGNLIVCIVTGCICSIEVEFIQFETERGYCQLDDIVMNTLGTVIGWVIYKIASLWIRRDKTE